MPFCIATARFGYLSRDRRSARIVRALPAATRRLFATFRCQPRANNAGHATVAVDGSTMGASGSGGRPSLPGTGRSECSRQSCRSRSAPGGCPCSAHWLRSWRSLPQLVVALVLSWSRFLRSRPGRWGAEPDLAVVWCRAKEGPGTFVSKTQSRCTRKSYLLWVGTSDNVRVESVLTADVHCSGRAVFSWLNSLLLSAICRRPATPSRRPGVSTS